MDRHGERSALVNDKIRDRGGQRGLRNVRISSTKSEPHMARWRKRVIAENLWEMGMNVIPGINTWSALTIWVILHFFLIEIRLRIHGVLAYITRGRRSGDNPFFLFGGRSPSFLPVSLCRNLIGENGWRCLRKRKWGRKGKWKESFGKEEGVWVWITKGLPLKYPGH